ncbi:MAG: hypothetical protein K2O12_03410, partial [Muribaculaceae bacterium]|nr:hypothetical protein [Muribaculaceae bacterium]
VAISSEGELSASDINVSLKFGIKNISFEETLSDGIRIEMYDDVPVAGYVLTLTSLTTGHTAYARELSPDERIIDISTFDMPSGIYVLSCTLDGEIVNTYKFTK